MCCAARRLVSRCSLLADQPQLEAGNWDVMGVGTAWLMVSSSALPFFTQAVSNDVAEEPAHVVERECVQCGGVNDFRASILVS